MKVQKTLIAAAVALAAAPAAAQQVTFMTGPQGGSWIPLGGALKGMWEKAVPGLSITQTPGAGIANVRGIDEGKAQIGLANSNTTVDGIDGRPPYPYDPDPVTLAKNSDVLMVITPGGPETSQLVNAQVLDALGPKGYLINIARGSVVDEPVLLRYLQEKKIAGAGLDVFADEPRVPPEFFTLDNAVLFPHVGSATVETRKAMGELQIENLRRHFAGKPVKTRVA